jgi:hypothetical protein
MDLFEFWRCEVGLGIAVEDFEVIGELEGLEEPKDALRARLLEPVLDISQTTLRLIDGQEKPTNRGLSLASQPVHCSWWTPFSCLLFG